jgi:thiamine biosynthesis lipoprotein
MRITPERIGKWGAAMLACLVLNLHPLRLPGQGVAHQFREVHLGLEVRISAHGPGDKAERAAAAAFDRIAQLEQVLSDWRPASELNRVGAHAGGEWQPISPDLETVLKLALEVAEASDGAFDPTVGALTRLWREERRTGSAADPEVLRAAHRTVGWRGVQLDTIRHRVRLTMHGTSLDLGGVAKGWILHQALRTMADHGVRVALIEAGGDLVAGESPPETTGWRINVRTATGDSVIVLHRAALATSGPSAQSIRDANGQPRSHVIDPATGQGLGNGAEVTVRARDGGIADAVATALTIMPREKWSELLERFGVELVTMVNGER